MKRSTLQTRVLLLLGIFVVVGFLSTTFSYRLDLTADKRYSLSDATKNILKSLDDPVTITVYFTAADNLPPNVARLREQLKDLLIEYSETSDGMLVYKFVNPNESDEIEQKALQAGIQQKPENVREKDQIQVMKTYRGLVIESGSDKDVIPIIQSNGLEYAITSSIKKVTITNKPKLGLIQGQGEATIQTMPQAMSVLNVLYDVQPVTISDTAAIPTSYKAIMIVAPKDSFTNIQLQRIDEFIINGGNVLMAINRVNGDFSTGMGSPVTTGLEGWLKKKGIEIEPKFVLDANCGQVTVQQRQGFFTINTPVQFPYLPLVSNFSDHPVSKGLKGVLFPFVSPVTHNFSDSTTKATVLAKSSQKSNTAGANTYFDYMKKYTEDDFPLSSLPLAIAAEGKFIGDHVTKMVVFGDGDFAVNGEGRSAQQQLNPDNVNLFVNAVEWLSDETGLNELRTKAVPFRPIKKELDASQRNTIKAVNFALPILLIIIYGLVRLLFRRRKRAKWLEVSYV